MKALILVRTSLFLVPVLLLSGCAQVGYYTHLANGQLDLLSRREPIKEILADPARDQNLKRRLKMVLSARRFAAQNLALPDNNSYTTYADLERGYAVLNVFATPEFSLGAVNSCFPIAGCVAYRGFYDQARANEKAARLKAQGLDVEIGRSPAYSTLGWFDDPILNTMMSWGDATLVGTLFHELAHQKLYVPGDTQFNESYASFVEQAGLNEYLGPTDATQKQRLERKRQQEQFVALILSIREELESLYTGTETESIKRREKARLFAKLKSNYEKLRDDQWNGASGYDAWFDRELNNASLLPVGLYDHWVPAFEKIFLKNRGDWPAFHAACRALGELPESERSHYLESLL